MNANVKQNFKQKEIVAAASQFLSIFEAQAAAQEAVPEGLGFSHGAAGYVSYSVGLIAALKELVDRCAKALGSVAAHENAIAQTVWKVAHDSIAAKLPVAVAATALLDAVVEAATTSVEFVTSNYLYHFASDVAEVRIGRVRGMTTSAFIAERASLQPPDPITVIVGDEYSFGMVGTQVTVAMPPVLWAVKVNAIMDNVEEEAKWQIDVAVSLLRLAYPPEDWHGLFPSNGEKESHPTRPTPFDDQSLKYQVGGKIMAGGGKLASWYEIDTNVRDFTLDASFVAKADLLSAPPDKSLAMRVSQGLGWITRGRQASDRAERLLYFFTAIEALLSNEDKTAPVVQTIARHGAVLLSADNSARIVIAGEIKRLYGFRSALVHQGKRSVFWSSANTAQRLAESMFFVVLAKADLKMAHLKFCDALSAASYGLPWPDEPAVDE